MKSLAFALAVALSLVAGAAETYASCGIDGSPPCAAYWRADAVFVGTVTEIVFSEKFSRGGGDDAFDYRRRITRFTAREAFRGVTGPVVEVVTLEVLPTQVTMPNGQQGMKIMSCDCTYKFETGETYLVYAHRREDLDNALNADSGRTRPLSSAADDLAYIRGLSSAAPGAFVYGAVRKHDTLSDDEQPTVGAVAGATVHVEGMGRHATAVTDAEGRYRVPGLEPGEYTVRFDVPSYLVQETEPQRVTVVDRGCAEVGFDTSTNGRVSGQVLDADGRPVFEMRVDLVVEARRDSSFPSPHMIYTDQEGRYEFTGLAPGRYVLGIGLGPVWSDGPRYARTFYPGTSDPAAATVITIGEGQALTNYALKLPRPLGERTIEGVVVFPDGRPAAGALVTTTMLEYPFDVDGPNVLADDRGRFTLKVSAGLAYAVGACVRGMGDRGQRHATPVDVASTGSASEIRLVIDRPGGHGLSVRQRERSVRQMREYEERHREPEP